MTIKTNKLPPLEWLREHFEYDAKTGKLTWKKPQFRSKAKVGAEVGVTRVTQWGKRYRCFFIRGKIYQVHRVIWKMQRHEIPDGYEIDHIDGNSLNNRIDNLRCVTSSENRKNRRMARNNTTGIVGVRQLRYGNKWGAHIKVEGKYIHLGTFDTKESAARARKEAERAHGFHENHGKEVAA